MAIISLIAGILSWLLLPGFGAVAGVITGLNARKQIRLSNGLETGNGLALTGIILSILDIVGLAVIVLLVMLGPVIAKGFRSPTP